MPFVPFVYLMVYILTCSSVAITATGAAAATVAIIDIVLLIMNIYISDLG